MPAAHGRVASGHERKGTRLILLGTKGGPRVGGGRNNASTLLVINGVPYVVDCGASTSRQLVAAGVPLNAAKLYARLGRFVERRTK